MFEYQYVFIITHWNFAYIGSIQDVEAYVNNLQVFTYGCNNHFVNDRECYDCPFGSKNAALVACFRGASVNSVFKVVFARPLLRVSTPYVYNCFPYK